MGFFTTMIVLATVVFIFAFACLLESKNSLFKDSLKKAWQRLDRKLASIVDKYTGGKVD